MRPVLRGKISTTGLRVGVIAALAIASVASLAAMRSAPAVRAGGGCSPTVSKQFFGKTIEPYTGKNTAVYRYTLTNCRGTQVRILTYGGIVQSIDTPSRHGREADVVLGFKTLKDYVQFVSPPVIANGGPYFGETIGRYGNRIAKGTFNLNGKTYTLPLNNGANSLHGGLVGFGNHIWASKAVRAPGSAGVRLTLVSPDSDASGAAGSPGCVSACTGYPAQLTVVVTYTLNNHGQLGIHYKATNNDKKLFDGAQPDQPQLLQHGWRGVSGRLGVRAIRPDQRQQVHAGQLDPDPARHRAVGQGHAVRLHPPAHDRFPDR